MANGGFLNGQRNVLLVAVVSAILGSTGGPFILVKLGINPYRQDAYTSTEAREHRASDERRFTALEGHVLIHPDIALRDQMSALMANQAGNSAKLEQIQRNQDRILNTLETHDTR